jgi:hypothetical protein
MADPKFNKLSKEEKNIHFEELCYKSDVYLNLEKMIENLQKYRKNF